MANASTVMPAAVMLASTAWSSLPLTADWALHNVIALSDKLIFIGLSFVASSQRPERVQLAVYMHSS